MRLEILEDKIAGFRESYIRRAGQADLLSSSLSKYKEELSDSKATLFEIEQALTVLSQLSDMKRKDLEEKIESLVSYALSSVFEYPYEFKILSSLRGNQMRMDFKIKVNGVETDIIDGQGGGIVDIVAFILRVINLLLYSPSVRRFIILDEFGKHISREYLPNVASLLKELSIKTGIQFLIITHAPELIECGDVSYTSSLNSKGHTLLQKD